MAMSCSRKPEKKLFLFLTILVVLVSIFASSSSASRPLHDGLHLPQPHKYSSNNNILLLPSATSTVGKVHSGRVTVPVRLPAAAGKYGPMILTRLPKGSVTPSGPSGRTNDKND